MGWAVQKYTKTQVKNAGRLIGSGRGTAEEAAEAREKVSNYRSAHAYPLFSVTIHVRKNALAVSPDALVVRRMKRLPTIVDKLRRHPHMNVTTMHDLGGTRAVLPTIQDVDALVARLKGATRAQNRILRTYDYLREGPGPQSTGYRGVHLVYEYNATKTEYHGALIEVQVRTQLQHAWATAVETLDLFGGTRLKYNEGDPKLKRYMLVVSALMAIAEGLPQPVGAEGTVSELRLELLNLELELGLLNRLEGYVAAVQQHGGHKRNTFLLELHRWQQKLVLTLFDNPAAAESRLAEIEAEDDEDVDAVLVSSKRIGDLRSAYPNYFADTTAFSNFVRREMRRL
ncbi:RelA/SpoT domain-containing protein [Microbacterium oleivorans]|uniref:RelA/SpoT domain-containing protein n=1 Tax=Microbacterium oleivorans TaxID=273677 RepID=A0A7D5EVP4_9MICO|nr:RelA/SpoT domain-containing protein [Microbacterium oleivorans]QLD10906.1 RelA/SpoT domain-containing protein [Microbacterium oleivorans]